MWVCRPSVVPRRFIMRIIGGPRSRAVSAESVLRSSARGGASKRRYYLVNLRFTSGWPPSKYDTIPCRSFLAPSRVPSDLRYLSQILPRWRETAIVLCREESEKRTWFLSQYKSSNFFSVSFETCPRNLGKLIMLSMRITLNFSKFYSNSFN